MNAIVNIPLPIPVREVTTVKEAELVTGKLSDPDKMPGKAWGIPASQCKRGGKLHLRPGTVCHDCYARKGRYVMPVVANAYLRRLQAYTHRPRWHWIQAMIFLIGKQTKKETPYFRVFDSGDLQDEDMLKAWYSVANNLPKIKFWLVTRERGIVRTVARLVHAPKNMVVRVSGDMVDDDGPTGFNNIGKVASKVPLEEWAKLVKRNTRKDWHCPAPLQDNRCGDCRACWDPKVVSVTYMKH